MGGSVSTSVKEVNHASREKGRRRRSEATSHPSGTAVEDVERLVDFFYPIYYCKDPLTDIEKERAIRCFKLISSNQAQEFYRMKRDDPVNVPCNSPMEFFGNRFYKRFIEVHPTSQPLFGKSTMKQGTLLYRMMTFVVGDLERPDPEKFQKTFEMLAHSHNRIGVRAAEYGIFGEVLFWVLKLTVGKEIYDVSTHSAWIKIYSRMLSIILPIVVKYELEHKDTVQRVDAKRMHTFITPTAENSMAESVLNGANHSSPLTSNIRPAEDLTGIAHEP